MISILLIIANIVVFYLLRKDRLDADKLGMSYYHVFVNHQYYRLFTAAFCHVDIYHLICNLVSLYNVGTAIERLFGSFGMLCIYFGSMILGELASLWMHHNVNDDYTLSIGASGPIFGLEGAYVLLIFLYYRNRAFGMLGSNLISMAVISLLPGVDGKTHLCCLIAGGIIAFLLRLF